MYLFFMEGAEDVIIYSLVLVNFESSKDSEGGSVGFSVILAPFMTSEYKGFWCTFFSQPHPINKTNRAPEVRLWVPYFTQVP